MQRTRPHEELPTATSAMVGPAPNLQKINSEVWKFGCFSRLLGDVCFLIEVVICQPLPSLSGDYVMQRDRAQSSQLVTPY